MSTGQVTQILKDLSGDDDRAAARLLPVVYNELRAEGPGWRPGLSSRGR